MSFITISIYKTTQIWPRCSDRNRGAENVYLVELESNQTRVLSVIPTQAIAAAAAEKQADVRTQGETELITKLLGVEQGEVFANVQP